MSQPDAAPDESEASVEYPATVNRIVFVGDFGVDEYEGPFEFDATSHRHGVAVPTDPEDYAGLSEMRQTALLSHEGAHVVAMADCEAVSGGPTTTVGEQPEEDHILVAYDPYARGGGGE